MVVQGDLVGKLGRKLFLYYWTKNKKLENLVP